MLSDYLNERTRTFEKLLSREEAILSASGRLVDCLKAGNKLLTCGNGGSAAEAQHFSTELVGRFKSNRRSLPAISLNADGSAITCIANDFGSDRIFSRQLEGLARPGDWLVAFTSSGNSANIVEVLRRAKDLGIDTLALLGKGGGECKGLATQEIIVPSDSTAVVQELHLFLIHFFCERIESAFA